MNNILLTNIQRFSLHDGPGIRTTVFLKGCSICCPWCSNPENLNPMPEHYIKDGKEGIYGKEYTVQELFVELMKDEKFYEYGGGVTFSGGEPLLQANEIFPLLNLLKDSGITIAIETSLFCSTKNLLLLLPVVDYFYVDMKIMDINRSKNIMKGNLSLYKKNLDILCKGKKITVRIPTIGRYTDCIQNRKLVIDEIKKHVDSIIKIELLKEHNLGKTKYESLGLDVPNYFGVTDELMLQYKKEIEEQVNIPVEICKI